MHCGMEVVLPTGEVTRTGMGALPGNNTWQAFQYGMFTQLTSENKKIRYRTNALV